MSRQSLTAVRSQAGFTLVELAVVMIIIGLLIGGVLKGQELVKNAQITSTVAQVKGIDAATTTFRDMYSAMPGDLRTPNTRLNGCGASPACTAANATADGNGQISTAPNVAPGVEATAYFTQLALADLLTGINTAAAVANCNAWGQCFPEAKAGSGAGMQIGYFGGGALGFALAASPAGRGHYLTIQTGPNAATGTVGGAQALTANQAARIDAKIDDGLPQTGSVVGNGAAACQNGAVYNEVVSTADCNLHIRIQG